MTREEITAVANALPTYAISPRIVRTVPVSITGRGTRRVEIAARIYRDERGWHRQCWFAVSAPAVYKFRTGTKLHTVRRPQVFEQRGQYFLGRETVHNRHCTAFDWAEQTPGNSGWTGNRI